MQSFFLISLALVVTTTAAPVALNERRGLNLDTPLGLDMSVLPLLNSPSEHPHPQHVHAVTPKPKAKAKAKSKPKSKPNHHKVYMSPPPKDDDEEEEDKEDFDFDEDYPPFRNFPEMPKKIRPMAPHNSIYASNGPADSLWWLNRLEDYPSEYDEEEESNGDLADIDLAFESVMDLMRRSKHKRGLDLSGNLLDTSKLLDAIVPNLLQGDQQESLPGWEAAGDLDNSIVDFDKGDDEGDDEKLDEDDDKDEGPEVYYSYGKDDGDDGEDSKTPYYDQMTKTDETNKGDDEVDAADHPHHSHHHHHHHNSHHHHHHHHSNHHHDHHHHHHHHDHHHNAHHHHHHQSHHHHKAHAQKAYTKLDNSDALPVPEEEPATLPMEPQQEDPSMLSAEGNFEAAMEAQDPTAGMFPEGLDVEDENSPFTQLLNMLTY
ncbi:uncharacterized protein VTP21DRAFT_3434 [Calcarisporiella thermophila]|uniref:uncharacterized protein n=1 Tax=Calcarisporiella thermophila TaxID=911321 RepID=UPI003742533A